jgi:DNA ligase (NAD+)
VLEETGFKVFGEYTVLRGLEALQKHYRDTAARRGGLPFEVDGVVVKVNARELQRRLGTISRSPRWAVAYKFVPEEARTRVKEIVHQVGRTGAVTPVAVLEPVGIGGVTVGRATLHNYEEVERKDVRAGDTVFVRRAGDVIPEVVKVIEGKRRGGEPRTRAPERCPSCGSPLVRIEGEVAVRCESLSCPAQLVQRICHFVSKDAMNIEHLGPAFVEGLVEKGRLSSVSDIYRLTEKDFFELPRMGEVLAKKLVSSIDRSREVPLDRFIFALGIRFVGQRTAQILSSRFGNLEALEESSVEELEEIEEIGPRIAESIRSFFGDERNREQIRRMRELGVRLTQSDVSGNGKLEGRSFVFTGALDSMTRREASRRVEEQGGRVLSSVSSRLDYLVCGSDPGSKLDRARENSVRVLDEAQFLKMIR